MIGVRYDFHTVTPSKRDFKATIFQNYLFANKVIIKNQSKFRQPWKFFEKLQLNVVQTSVSFLRKIAPKKIV